MRLINCIVILTIYYHRMIKYKYTIYYRSISGFPSSWFNFLEYFFCFNFFVHIFSLFLFISKEFHIFSTHIPLNTLKTPRIPLSHGCRAT